MGLATTARGGEVWLIPLGSGGNRQGRRMTARQNL